MIFHDDSDRKRYLLLLEEVQNKYRCKLYAYVLMGNHVHQLVEAGVAPLSKIMQNLQFRYTRYYNLRYRKTGHLFEGRYKAILCDRNNYLQELVRYTSGSSPGGFKQADRWLSLEYHPSYLRGDDKGGVSVSAVLEQFENKRGETIRMYRKFINDGLGDGHREEYYQVVDQRLLGNEEFVAEVRGRLEEPEMRYPLEIELRDIAKLVCDEFGIRAERVYQREKSREVSQLRWIIGKLACEEAGNRLTEVARFFGRDAGVMSRGLRLLQERLTEEKELQRRVDKLRRVMREGRKGRITKKQA